MNKDSVVQILIGVIGTLATLLGVWVAWRASGGKLQSLLYGGSVS